METASRLKMFADVDAVRASLSASGRPRRYDGRSTGVEVRESSSREESDRSEIVPSVGRGAMIAKKSLQSSPSDEVYQVCGPSCLQSSDA